MIGLSGCSKAAVAPAPVAVVVVAVTTNASRETLVTLSLTNNLATSVLVGVRSIIHQTNGAWFTNFGMQPRFVGVAGVGSEDSDVTLAAGTGRALALSPLKVSGPYQVELICFPARTGLAGVVDDTGDKLQEFKDGVRHESFLGESVFIQTPVINQ